MVQWPWHRLCHNFKSFFLDANGVFLICSLILWLKMIHTQKTKQPTKTTGNGSVFLPFQKSNFSDKGDIKFTVSDSWVEHWIIKEVPTDSDGYLAKVVAGVSQRKLAKDWGEVTQWKLAKGDSEKFAVNSRSVACFLFHTALSIFDDSISPGPCCIQRLVLLLNLFTCTQVLWPIS